MKKSNRTLPILIIIGCVLMAAGILVAICSGSKSIPLSTVWEGLFHYNEEELDHMFVRDYRLPRAICSFLVGGFLAISGGAMQGITRNPIAEPTILGVSQGATLAVAISAVYLGKSSGFSVVVLAMLGAIVSGGFLLLVSLRTSASHNMAKLLLAGTASSTFLISLASTVALLGNRSQELAFWVAGGFSNTDWTDGKVLLVCGVLPMLLLCALSSRINILNLGEEVAIGLGVHPQRLQMVSVGLIIPMCAASVAVAGNISFLGLVVPHILRGFVGADYRKLLPLSFLFGGVVLVWADILAKMIHLPYETPIGIFTALLGVPFFLWLVRKERN